MNFNEIVEFITENGIDLVMDKGPKILLAIVILVAGLWLIKKTVNLIGKLMERQKLEKSLHSFMKSLLSILLKVMLVITVMTMIGVEMTSFIAVLGAAGLAIGMAFSGTLQNFASGVMILVFKPYVVGDFIKTQDFEGTVEEIQIFNTILINLQAQTVILSNSSITGGSIVNYTKNPYRRVDVTIGISYGDSIDKAREIIMDVVNKEAKVLSEPEKPFVKIEGLGDSSVNFTVRVWVLNEHYWDVYFYLNEYVKKAFDENGISIPFPQTDVHVHNVK